MSLALNIHRNRVILVQDPPCRDACDALYFFHHLRCWSQSLKTQCSEHWPQMSILVGHITAGGFSRNMEPVCWPGAAVVAEQFWVYPRRALASLCVCVAFCNRGHSVPWDQMSGEARPVKQLAYCFQLFKKKGRKEKKKHQTSGMFLPWGAVAFAYSC